MSTIQDSAPEKICTRCGGTMELAVKSYPMGSVFQMNRFHADIFCCSKCKKIELFAAERDMVTCPVCGSSHPAQERCVTCALDSAFGGTEAQERLIPKA